MFRFKLFRSILPGLARLLRPFGSGDFFRSHPCLIVEVLSEATERIDHCEKYLSYITLPSLQAYWLVAQDACRVEAFRRSND